MTFVKTTLFHKAGEGSGGGGGDQHNLGWYATETALTTAHPTASDGDYAIVGDTDTVWVWDGDTTAWVDSGAGGIGLPSQTGNAGKFLTTDGTDASWSDKPLVNNNPRNTTSIMIGNIGSTIDSIGMGSVCLTSNNTYSGWVGLGGDSVAIGTQNCGGSYSVAIGSSCSCARNYSTAIGYSATSVGSTSSNHNIALGAYANAGAGGMKTVHAIQIGSTGSTTTNSDSNTFKVGNQNGNFEMMSADGTIPHARLVNAVSSTSVTIATTDWSSNTASVTVSGLTATSVVWVAPDNASQSAYTTAGVYASGQATDTLTFTCTQTPTASLTINVVFC